MTKQMIELTYGEARYEVLKELDTHGAIGRFLIKRHPNLINNIEYICRFLEQAMDPQTDISTLGNFPVNIKTELSDLMSNLPTYVILYSEMDWTLFLSGFCLLINNYLEAEKMFYSFCDPSEEFVQKDLAFIELIKERILAITKIIEIGTSFTDLIKIAHKTVEMLQESTTIQPASMKLSQMYLESLGIKGEKK